MKYRSPLPAVSSLVSTLVLVLPSQCLAQDSVLEVGAFSSASSGQTLPSQWVPFKFPQVSRYTDYELVKDGDVTVVRASSNNAASGLARKVNIDLQQYPVVQWRWKISNLIDKSDATSKKGDDYPARLYITFDYDPQRLSWFERIQQGTYRLLYGEAPPLAVLNYMWDRRLPVDTLLPNVYSKRVQMIVVRSGADHIGEWLEEKRNINQDYLRAFGEAPPVITSVAIMTDTDNTGESAVTYYGDIRFLPAVAANH